MGFLVTPAFSQTSSDAAQPTSKLEEVQITATRLRSLSADAPTPTQVLDAKDIENAAPKLIDDLLNQIPSITGSMTLRSRAVQASNGTNGISTPALRSIGSNRTLVLLDGQRSVAVTQTGETDALSFPSQLVKRVDVVTGGASALYGSDALAGVVNFILDKKFTGFKFEASGGMSAYHDDFNHKLAGAFGTAFAEGRGHFLTSLELQDNATVGRDRARIAAGLPPARAWEYGAPQLIANPACVTAAGSPACTNGVPMAISSVNGQTFAAAAASTPGGIINSGPLKGTAFTNAGTPYAFNYGVNDGLYMIGGDWQKADVMAMTGIDPSFNRKNFFARASYDVSPDTNLYVQYQHSATSAYGNFSTRIWQGPATAAQTGSLVLRSDNAYLQQALASDPTRLALLNSLATVTFGKVSEAEALGGAVDRTFDRFVLGGTGEFNFGGSPYTWRAYYQFGRSKVQEQIAGSFKVDNFTRAIDAISVGGKIVCRSYLTNPDCVPLNLVGYTGTVDPAALAYSFGRPTRNEEFTQQVFSFDIAGEPVNLWAGPLSMVVGGEARNEKVVGSVDDRSTQGNVILSNGQADTAHGWSTNFIPLNGEYHVEELFMEAGLPLLTKAPFAKSLSIDAAIRATHYSVSGAVTTWKLGSIWEPTDGLRFRLSQSKDIRAPAMGELFTKGLSITAGVSEVRNGVTTSYPQNIVFTTGSTSLKPEKADTTGIGMVIQPAALPGFSFSVDGYQISVKDAIGTLAPQTIVTQCSLGNTVFCPAIVRNSAGSITQVNNTFFNFTNQEYKGLDFEASYRTKMEGGALTLNALATHFIKAISNDGISPQINYVGALAQSNATPNVGSLPSWKYRLTGTYDTGPMTFTLVGRGSSAGTWDTPGGANIQCTSSCPSTLPPGVLRTVDNNYAPSAFYMDTTIIYKPKISGYQMEFFLNINNIANKDPALQPKPPGSLAGGLPTNPLVYDTLGRTYSLGLRLKM
jgi:outer membrane receptor protein involved in Fe transport